VVLASYAMVRVVVLRVVTALASTPLRPLLTA